MGIGRPERETAGAERSASVAFTNFLDESSSMREDIIAGLQSLPKAISPKYLYDERGSFLFDLICELPEYYPTRTEISILKRHGRDMVEALSGDICLIELGAGACQKSGPLLETGAVSTFIPVDICEGFLWQSAIAVSSSFPRLAFHAVAMDFLNGLGRIGSLLPARSSRLIFLAGSSIGNFEPPDACDLLRQFRQLLREGDAVLIGYDLRKDPDVLYRAYNDSRGITAAFNMNLLARLNRELSTNFDLRGFRHVAFYNPVHGRVEMHLESMMQQEASMEDSCFFFDKGESIHTENSYKYSIDGFDALAVAAGLERVKVWMDTDGLFAVALYAPKG